MEYRLSGDNRSNPEEEAASSSSPKMSLVAMVTPHHPSAFRRDIMWDQPRTSGLSIRQRSDQERVALPSIRQVTTSAMALSVQRGACRAASADETL